MLCPKRLPRGMDEAIMQHVQGIITVVQEGRFRLAAEGGRSLLFVLSSRAPIEPQDLDELLGRRVDVTYSAAENRKAFTAHNMRLES